MSSQTDSKPDLAELKRAALKKVRALTDARAAAQNTSPGVPAVSSSPANGSVPVGPDSPQRTENDAAVRLLIQEKNELRAALEEQRARGDRLEALAAGQQQQPAVAETDLRLQAENDALKRHMGALSDRIAELEEALKTAGRDGDTVQNMFEESQATLAALRQESDTRAQHMSEDMDRRALESARQVEALNSEAIGLRENFASARRERDEALERNGTLEKSIEMLETKVRNLTTREELAITWKTKTERLTAENNRLLEERTELQGRLAELATSNAALTLALDTAQRHLASQPESPDPSPRLGRKNAEDLQGREALPSPPASVPDQTAGNDVQLQLQVLTDQNLRLAEELAKEREISERLAAQVDEIPGFIVKFVEQRQKAVEMAGHSPGSSGHGTLDSVLVTHGLPPSATAGRDYANFPALQGHAEGDKHAQGDFYHCPTCFEAQEVFL